MEEVSQRAGAEYANDMRLEMRSRMSMLTYKM